MPVGAKHDLEHSMKPSKRVTAIDKFFRRVNVITSEPTNDAMAVVQSRVASFQKVPWLRSQKPEDMARAGLYFTGVKLIDIFLP